METFTKLILILIIVISVLSIFAIAAGAVVLSDFADSKVDDELISGSIALEPTEFYCIDKTSKGGDVKFVKMDGQELYGGARYKYVSYGELPKNLINAFVAIEDKRFFEHHGIDYKRSVGAVFNYVLGGKKSYGGSTITQQLVKNLTGENEPSISRKLKEAFSAMELEGRLDKSEILEKYLNVINLSHGCYGVGAAAEYYFSKSVCELDLCECASIAAITNNPSRYSPINNPKDHTKRRDLVLLCMLEQGYITQKQYDDAKNTPLKLNLSKSSIGKVNSWYVDMVVEDVIGDLAEKEGITKQTAAWLLYRGGYRIYTAMDAEIQTVLEEYYENECNFPISKSGELPQCAMIIMDQGTGNILGVAGAIGQKRGNRIQSYATDTLRPTGSVIKPLSVYAKAIDDGLIDWSTILSDTPIIEQTDTTPAWPANANGRYLGDVTLRYSIDQSLNTVPIKLLWKIGNENAFSFLHDKLLMHSLDPDTDKGDAALALGQMTKGVTLRQTVAAYTIFENGVMSKPRSYFKVTDANGVIVLNNSPSREQVISEESAAIMTKLMQSVVENGTAKGRISLTDKCEVAGKSGTTQNSCDRYFIGYTPSLLGGVWFGYDYPKPLYEFGGNLSVTVWDEVMNEIYDKTDYKNRAASFYVPDTVQPLTYDTKTGSTDPLQIDGENSDVGWFAMN